MDKEELRKRLIELSRKAWNELKEIHKEKRRDKYGSTFIRIGKKTP